jgi:hypothetical protein
MLVPAVYVGFGLADDEGAQIVVTWRAWQGGRRLARLEQSGVDLGLV